MARSQCSRVKKQAGRLWQGRDGNVAMARSLIGFSSAIAAVLCAILCLLTQCATSTQAQASAQTRAEVRAQTSAQTSAETRYLLFQIFTYAGESNNYPSIFPSHDEISNQVEDILTRIGTRGGKLVKLGFAVGPLTFNHSDSQIRTQIKQSFQIAREKNVAVAFHIDDEKFWQQNNALNKDKNNVEWLDWKGTPCTGRRLDWGPAPTRVGPQMCFNSPAIKAAVAQRAHLIGTQIKREVDALKAAGKEDLFAGVITGWETMIGRDFARDQVLGYHALINKGFSAKTTPAQCDLERIKIVKEFIELWSRGLGQAGIAPNKIYSHIAFTSQGLGSHRGRSFAQEVGFATPEVAFSHFYRPGFSTYPMEGVLEQIGNEVAKRGTEPWISAEGTNVVPNGVPGESTMETYLAKMFNHGAVMVTIFSWNIGGEAQKNNLFRRATESDEALSAYRKFLNGKTLVEQPRSTNQFSIKRFQAKIKEIQVQVPAWVQKTRRVEIVQPLMTKLDGLIKNNRFEDADKMADQILNLVNGK